jgi:hypothetical protein
VREFRDKGLWFRLRVYGLRARVQLRVWGLEFRV